MVSRRSLALPIPSLLSTPNDAPDLLVLALFFSTYKPPYNFDIRLFLNMDIGRVVNISEAPHGSQVHVECSWTPSCVCGFINHCRVIPEHRRFQSLSVSED